MYEMLINIIIIDISIIFIFNIYIFLFINKKLILSLQPEFMKLF